MKYCHTKNDVPKTKHYAIVIFSSYTVPGDERSRTNPGHGYPEHTESTADYIAFDNRAEWESEIRLMSNPKSYTKSSLCHRSESTLIMDVSGYAQLPFSTTI